MIDLIETFANYEDEYIKFDRVINPLSSRPDLCAFILLDKLVPQPTHDIIGSAEHDEIFLDVDCDKLAIVATEADIITLIRCGVRYDHEYDSLAMFV